MIWGGESVIPSPFWADGFYLSDSCRSRLTDLMMKNRGWRKHICSSYCFGNEVTWFWIRPAAPAASRARRPRAFALRALSQLVCLSWVLHRGQQPPPPQNKSFHWSLMSSQQASRWADSRCQGALLQRRLDKSNRRRPDIINPDAVAWANTRLPTGWWIGTGRSQWWTFS